MQSDEPLVDTLRTGLRVFMRRSMSDVIRFSKESGLSTSQLIALFQIDRQPACGVSDLGDKLGISHAASSQLLDRLVHQGLASRSEDPHDRRLKHIILTAKGRRVLHASLRAHQSWLEDVAGRLTLGERKQVLKTLKTFIEKAEQLEPAVNPDR
jgi:DNA-binding MarR family transcriptional regulator